MSTAEYFLSHSSLFCCCCRWFYVQMVAVQSREILEGSDYWHWVRLVAIRMTWFLLLCRVRI